jgi:predicted kinase
MLIIIGGLPGAGKTTIARELARQIGAVHIRIDSIEQAMRDSGVLGQPIDDAGYRVGYAIAEDNLRIGRTVIADSVNPLAVTRDAWLAVASRAQVIAIEIEITCSDSTEHRRRVETRVSDIVGLHLPTWREVVTRDYQSWNREHLVIDTAGQSIDHNIRVIREALRRMTPPISDDSGQRELKRRRQFEPVAAHLFFRLIRLYLNRAQSPGFSSVPPGAGSWRAAAARGVGRTTSAWVLAFSVG